MGVRTFFSKGVDSLRAHIVASRLSYKARCCTGKKYRSDFNHATRFKEHQIFQL